MKKLRQIAKITYSFLQLKMNFKKQLLCLDAAFVLQVVLAYSLRSAVSALLCVK